MEAEQDRYERERRYHDERYAEDPRHVTAKYYAVDGGKATDARGGRVLSRH